MVNLNFSDFDRFNHLGLFFSALGFLGYIWEERFMCAHFDGL
jgi:hypothetical protein